MVEIAPKIQAITIWQPYASLIAASLKRFEFRNWAAPKANRWKTTAIHAGTRAPPAKLLTHLQYEMQRDRGLALCGIALHGDDLEHALDIIRQGRFLPRGAAIATVVLGDPKLSEALLPVGPIVKWPDKWAWPMFPATPRIPIKIKGQQGFFSMTVPEDWKDLPPDVG